MTPDTSPAAERERLKALVAARGSQASVAARLRNPATGRPIATVTLKKWLAGERRVPAWALRAIRRLPPLQGTTPPS